MIIAKTKEEIELMREAALVVSKTLGKSTNFYSILNSCFYKI